MAFQYEKNLSHQEYAIEAVIDALQACEKQKFSSWANDLMIDTRQFNRNMQNVQRLNRTDDVPLSGNPIIDIAMETGTGKTYTYAKTMYELHHTFGLFKFVVVVPTLSIKAGTENFLKSQALAKHFRLDFEGQYGNSEIALYVVQSQKARKGKRQAPLTEVARFVQATDKNKIHVLLINQGMINSDSMAGKLSDGSELFANEFAKPFEAVASTRPVVIIDEPHKFDKANKTWGNIAQFKPLLMLRYGATFKEYENLLYRLSAVQALNEDLVKGVKVFVERLEGDDGTVVTLLGAKKETATFALSTSKKEIVLKPNDSLGIIHPNLHDIYLEGAKSNEVMLNNGLTLRKGDSLNPFAYDDVVSDKMLRNAIRVHFDTEKSLLSRTQGRIKPLTLFFIDDIKGYREGRSDENSLINRFEAFVKAEAKKRLEVETDPFYKAYLEKTLTDVSATHGGYFAQDNSESDEKIEKEIEDILHNKERLLSLDNPRRFIFSKWTLREGWDNPNVFGICKLRTSGSEISKLQEVGRGLRLPVNEYMARVKDGSFYLNYFVDSREKDFADRLVLEVNSQMVAQEIPKTLNNDLIDKILQAYSEKTKRQINNEIYDNRLINDNEEFIDENGKVSNAGFYKLQELYPLAFKNEKIDKNKIRNADEAKKQTVKMRLAKYNELRTLWEKINQKVILNYQIENEQAFLNLFVRFLESDLSSFKQSGSLTVKSKISVQNNTLVSIYEEEIEKNNFEPIPMMSYAEFLKRLSEKTLIQRNTLHCAFRTIIDKVDIRLFLNQQTINLMSQKFNRWLLMNSFTAFEVGYLNTNSEIHPTKFTDKQGKPLVEVDSNIFDGELDENCEPLPQFLFDKVFSNSSLERDNITTNEVKEVVVFTKIPKNSIKIPVAGGGSYSPDFAYVVKTSNGDILNMIIETKGVEDNESLRKEEIQKIKHAEKLFAHISKETKVIFKTQFQDEHIANILKIELSKTNNYL